MNVYEYAMKVEKDGEAYYREMADSAGNSGLKKIFLMLAEEEVKHYHVFKSMMNQEELDLDKLNLITDTKTIFETLQAQKNKVDINKTQINFYKDAIAREENSHDFYVYEASKISNQIEKAIFLKIADEEIKHKKVLEEIVHFLEEPADWVASAEF